MQHPFISDLSDKSLEELQTTISNLTNKITYAYRTGNGPLINQLLMAIDSYKIEYSKRMDEMIRKQEAVIKIEHSND